VLGPFLVFKLLNQAAETIPFDFFETDGTSESHLPAFNTDHFPVTPAGASIDPNLLANLQRKRSEYQHMMSWHLQLPGCAFEFQVSNVRGLFTDCWLRDSAVVVFIKQSVVDSQIVAEQDQMIQHGSFPNAMLQVSAW
jgi:hypothetical protein